MMIPSSTRSGWVFLALRKYCRKSGIFGSKLASWPEDLATRCSAVAKKEAR